MKFARYLEETQVPEWKKAYIDYRGLKKRITACRREQERTNGKRPVSPQLDSHVVTTRSHATKDLQPDVPEPGDDTAPRNELESRSSSREDSPTPVQRPEPAALQGSSRTRIQDLSASSVPATPHHFSPTPHFVPTPARSRDASNVADLGRPNDLVQRSANLNTARPPALRKRSTFRLPASLKRGIGGHWELNGDPKLPWDPTKSIPLVDLMPLLTSTQRSFFDKLDYELDKVEKFYVEREKETTQRVFTLKAQLHELQAHRQEYYDTHQGSSWMNFSLVKSKPRFTDRFQSPDTVRRRRYPASRLNTHAGSSATKLNKTLDPAADSSGSDDPESPVQHRPGSLTVVNDTDSIGPALGRKGKHGPRMDEHPDRSARTPLQHDPEEYYQAKKKLRKAVQECYRGLEILNNYRTLNIIGFRKALKKFEKITKIPCQQAYTAEQIEPNAFMSANAVEGMMRDLEELFAARFTHGDKKKALNRLRGGGLSQRSHHFSTFRSGVMLGLAVPALIDGLVQTFHADTRQAIPGWDGLLNVYAIFFVPVFFSLLVGLNLQVWAASRINYVFIFELDLRNKLDHRQFYELPAFFMCTLCYAFWISFRRIGGETVDPTIWPLVWLGLVFVVLVNPLPIWFKPSRYWLIKNVTKLLISGTQRVEFADFWMGDQFCSLLFTLSNLYFIPCVYATGGFDENWQRCTSQNPRWGIPYLLASLPLLARAIQSVKRWYDSRLFTHLINGGKYAMGLIYYLSYYIWRNQGGGHGHSFVAWIVFATLYAAYAGSWDLLMDWSLLRPHARYTLLRSDLLYTNTIPVYYFAIVSNIILRFSWVLYIPQEGPSFLLRSFITAMLEVLRRWQWNFLRLENEHLGNVDQYRVTREVPLPYTVYDGDDTDDEDERRSNSKSSGHGSAASSIRWRRRRNTTSQHDDDADQLSSD